MDEQHRAFHVIITLGRHMWSDYVGRDMPSLALGRIHGRSTSAWHVIITFGLHILSDDIGRYNGLIALGQHTRSDDIGR